MASLPLYSPQGSQAFGRGIASPDRSAVRSAIVAAVTLLLLSASQAAAPFSPFSGTVALSAILILGLPHGALDMAIIRGGQRRLLAGDVLRRLALYIGCALAMALVWIAAPGAALGLFLIIAGFHFAEDWTETLPAPLAHATAIAILAAPALFQREELLRIFALLVDPVQAEFVGGVLMLVAPVALVCAAVGIMLHWSDGDRGQAVETGSALLAMAALPPLLGFAIYFCLSHSPKQFAHARDGHGHTQRIGRDVLVVTALALAIAATLTLADSAPLLPDRLTFATFVTLSILTVPHMLVPLVLGMLSPGGPQRGS
jgi:beta-carotene 15,15'-dioxygenase